MGWNKLTQLSGETVFVQDRYVSIIRKAMHGEFPCKVGAVLEVPGYGTLAVLEDCGAMLDDQPTSIPFYAMGLA